MSTSSSPLRPKPLHCRSSASRLNSASVRAKPKPIFRLLRYLLLLIALFLLYKFAAIGYYGWRIYQAAQTLQSVCRKSDGHKPDCRSAANRPQPEQWHCRCGKGDAHCDTSATQTGRCPKQARCSSIARIIGGRQGINSHPR